MDQAQQRHDRPIDEALPPPGVHDRGELDRLIEEGERLRERSRDLVAHGRELTEHSKHLREQMRKVWEAGPLGHAAAPDDPAIQPDPET
jgi:hypothetical protein